MDPLTKFNSDTFEVVEKKLRKHQGPFQEVSGFAPKG
jgi:hypothetical protein